MYIVRASDMVNLIVGVTKLNAKERRKLKVPASCVQKASAWRRPSLLRTEMSPVAILISLSKITAGPAEQRSVSVILSSNDISDYDYLRKREG